jgi:hypothetical protein
VRSVRGRGLDGAHDQSLDAIVVEGPRGAGPRLVAQAAEAAEDEAALPLADRGARNAEPRGDVLVGRALSRREDDASTQGESLWAVLPRRA